jgi:hypothetical protein
MAALIAVLSTAILNSLGRIAAFLFSWAMVGFFGKMPPKRQYILAGISLMSILWVVFVLSIVAPEITQFLFLLNKNLGSPRIKELIQRFAILLVILLPFLIGFASLFVDNKPPDTLKGKAVQIAKGWIIAPGFALGIVLMMVTSVVVIAITYLKRLKTEHVPIKLKENGYGAVMHDIRDALTQNELPVRETEMPWLLKPPVLVMGFLAKSLVEGLVTPEAKMLVGDNGLSIVVHPTDMIIAGPKSTAAEARAVITQRVPFTEAYLTWEEKSQQFEDRITTLYHKWHDNPAGKDEREEQLKEIETLKGDLHSQDMPFDQWEVVYRELLQLQDEVVSGRIARGEAPTTSAPEDAKVSAGKTDHKASAKNNGKATGNADDTEKTERKKAAPQGKISPPMLPELAIISLLVFLLVKRRRDD